MADIEQDLDIGWSSELAEMDLDISSSRHIYIVITRKTNIQTLVWRTHAKHSHTYTHAKHNRDMRWPRSRSQHTGYYDRGLAVKWMLDVKWPKHSLHISRINAIQIGRKESSRENHAETGWRRHLVIVCSLYIRQREAFTEEFVCGTGSRPLGQRKTWTGWKI